MAKVVMEFDTSEKTLKVTMDGIPMDNVTDVESYRSYMEDGTFRLSITQVEEKEEDGMHVITRTVAMEDDGPKVVEEKEEYNVTEKLAQALNL